MRFGILESIINLHKALLIHLEFSKSVSESSLAWRTFKLVKRYHSMREKKGIAITMYKPNMFASHLLSEPGFSCNSYKSMLRSYALPKIFDLFVFLVIFKTVLP